MFVIEDNYNIRLTQGDTHSITFTFFNNDNTPYNLHENENVFFIVARGQLDKIINDNVIELQESNTGSNTVTFILLSDTTNNLTCGEYLYTIRFVYNGNIYTPYNTAKFIIEESLEVNTVE